MAGKNEPLNNVSDDEIEQVPVLSLVVLSPSSTSLVLQSVDASAALQFAKLAKCNQPNCKQLLCAVAFPQCNIIGSESAPVCATLCRACYASCPQDNSRTACGQMHSSTASMKVYSTAGSCSLGIGNTSVAV